MDEYLVQESDGTSKFTLEDGSGSLLLEVAAASDPTTNADPNMLMI
jgi:hypothetical protein